MQKKYLKIISLNIEMDRHLDRIIPFFKAQQPDVILLQEVLAKDRINIEQAVGMTGVYTPQNILCTDKSESPIGLLTLSKLPITEHYSAFYYGDNAELLPMTILEPEKMTRAILVTNIIKDHQHYCLVNTHFTWSPKGTPSENQHRDLEVLLQRLSQIPEFILCGDFNAPRGTSIFDMLASRYKDNIPQEVTTTIDKNLHREAPLTIVVDGVFTTPRYQVEQINIVDNVSDHCALVVLAHAAPMETSS